MATFQYQARTPAGEIVTGLIQADNEAAVVRALDERELYPVRVAERRVSRQVGGGRVRMRDVGIVYAPQPTYIIAVLSDRGGEPEPIAFLSHAVYDYFNR